MRIDRFAFDGYRLQSAITNPVSCVETLTQSGQPRVVGYEWNDDGTANPVFAPDAPPANNDDRTHLWAGALETARNLPSLETLATLGCSPRSLADEARSVLALWWTEPTATEVETLRGLTFEADDNGQVIKPVVNPYSVSEIAPTARRARQWREGSAAVTPLPLRAAATVLRFIRSSLDALGR